MSDFETLEDSARNIFGRVMWSHKVQEKQADIFAKRLIRLTVVNIVLSSVVSAGLVSTIFVDQRWIKIASAVLSFLSTTFIALSQQLKLDEKIQVHRLAATDYLSLKDRLMLLLMKIHLRNDTFDSLVAELMSINEEVGYVNSSAPQTGEVAVKQADVALNVKKDDDITNEEINRGLPRTLRKEDAR